MRIWLAGSKAFAAVVYREFTLIPWVEVVGVTAPNQRDPLALTAHEKAQVTLSVKAKLLDNVDLIVSAQNLAHISDEARAAAKWGAIGYHPSLLPRWRGANAVQATIDNKDPIAGGTVYLLDDGWDTGPIIKQDWCHVESRWTAKDLWRERLFPMGVDLLKQVILGANISHVANHGVPWELKPQDSQVVTTC